MRTWRDAALHLFLQEGHRSVAQRKCKHKVALLAAAAARNESAQQKEAITLVRNLIQFVQELDAPQLEKWPSAEASIPLHHELLPEVTGGGQTTAEACSFPSLEASSQDALGGTPLPQPDLLLSNDDWLDRENFPHAEESWLLDTRSESSSGTEGVPEGRVKERCRGVESDGRWDVVKGDVLLEVPGDSLDGTKAEEEPRPHDNVIASGLRGTQLLKSAKSAIVSHQKTGGGGLQELRAVCNALEKLRVIRLAEVHFLSRRLSGLQARVLRWRTLSAMGFNMEATNVKSRAGSDASCNQGFIAFAEGREVRTEESGETVKDSPPGWLSLDQIDVLRLRVRRLEAILAATCQEIVGRMRALWDQLGVPLESRAASEAEGRGLDVLVRYDCLEQQLVNLQAQVTLLQPIILLGQQCDELGRQLESQAATCREASKHLLSRKADGASALRRAEAERKRLLRQHSMTQKQLGGAIGEWERTTGGNFSEDLLRRWKEERGSDERQDERQEEAQVSEV